MMQVENVMLDSIGGGSKLAGGPPISCLPQGVCNSSRFFSHCGTRMARTYLSPLASTTATANAATSSSSANGQWKDCWEPLEEVAALVLYAN